MSFIACLDSIDYIINNKLPPHMTHMLLTEEKNHKREVFVVHFIKLTAEKENR